MKKQLAALGMSAALLSGGAMGVVLANPSTASAASSSASSTASGSTDAKPGAWMQDALAKLVDGGTLTRAQANKVAAALEAARPDGGPRGGGPGRHRGPGLEVAATALGIDASALRTQLHSGKTIADVAKAQNVDVNKVIAAIVADMNEHLAQAVTDGHLTQAQADQRKADDDCSRHRPGQRRASGASGRPFLTGRGVTARAPLVS